MGFCFCSPARVSGQFHLPPFVLFHVPEDRGRCTHHRLLRSWIRISFLQPHPEEEGARLLFLSYASSLDSGGSFLIWCPFLIATSSPHFRQPREHLAKLFEQPVFDGSPHPSSTFLLAPNQRTKRKTHHSSTWPHDGTHCMDLARSSCVIFGQEKADLCCCRDLSMYVRSVVVVERFEQRK